MKKWFYRNAVLIYVLVAVSVLIGVLYCIQQRISEEIFNILHSFVLVIYFMIAISVVFVGIWSENKLKKLEKENKL